MDEPAGALCHGFCTFAGFQTSGFFILSVKIGSHTGSRKTCLATDPLHYCTRESVEVTVAQWVGGDTRLVRVPGAYIEGSVSALLRPRTMHLSGF